MIFRVTITGTDRLKTIEARNELEAKLKYCQEEGLLYRVYMGKLEVTPVDYENKGLESKGN